MLSDFSSLRNLTGKKITARELIFIGAAVICLTPFISPPIALFMGIFIAQFIGHPYLKYNHTATHFLLQISIVGLGFGMDFNRALIVGIDSFIYTITSIFSTFLFGYCLTRLFKIDQKTGLLITSGTAICGGSAIAAVSPVIKAEDKQISVALGTVFILNAVALMIFPFIGKAFHLSQAQFGLWCAIAIHDTSSVVGAAGKYGVEALGVATTVKLARSLWIIPVTILSALIFKSKTRKIKLPYFIAYFILAMLANTLLPQVHILSPAITGISKSLLTLTLFLIGSGMSQTLWKSVGAAPLILGFLLWMFISLGSLVAILLVH